MGEPQVEADGRQVPWRDLVGLRPVEVVRELLLPLPWLAGSLLLADQGLYLPALALSFVFFLTGLRIVHGGFHGALGLPRRTTEIVLVGFSQLMLGSMHAVRWNHLRHHRHCLADEDIEAMGARRSAWGAIRLGPVFPWRLHRAALAGAPPQERWWITTELAGNAAILALVATVLPHPVLAYHLLAMAAGQCLTAFFAVWTVHHDCTGADLPARTIRNRLRAMLTFNMLFHLEHHLYPQVPTPHLPLLARRIDDHWPQVRWLLVW